MNNVKTRSAKEIAPYIDHTLLKPTMSDSDLESLCKEARDHNFCSVCIPPSKVKLAKKLVKNSPVKVCTVVGFPLGYNETEVKVYETKLARENGADEIDMVINSLAVKNKDFAFVEKEIKAVVHAAGHCLVKVIIETSQLSNIELEQCCHAAKNAGAHFVKTSTGFSGEGATIEAVSLMRKAVGEKMGVKASGGIRNFAQADAMITAGASRLGCSSGVQIVTHPHDFIASQGEY